MGTERARQLRSRFVSQTSNAYNNLGTRAYTNRPASSSVYTYDAVARLSQLGQHFVSSASNLEQGFGYNNASQITTATRDNDAFVFDGLVAVNRNYTVNGLNQYTAVGALPAFQYDDNGNLTYDGSNSYAYDAENRLVRVTGARTANLVYDPLGRLLQVDEGTSGTTSLFLYDGDNLAAEYAGDGAAMSKRYVFGRGVDEPIAEATGSLLDCSSAKFLHADNQGSIIARADCSGNIVNRNTYDEWGIPGTGNAGRFQYTGQMWMPEIGMYYYKARIYSPTLGRFLQTDAIGYKDQINLYAYVGNDPVNGTDPSGLATVLRNLCTQMPSLCQTSQQRQGGANPQTKSGIDVKPKVAGSTVAGAVGQAHSSVADAARSTGATARDVAPVRGLGHAMGALGGALKAKELHDEGHSTTASVAGGAASAAPATAIGAAIGTVVEPGGGTLLLGAVGWGVDELLGLGDKAGDVTADMIDHPEQYNGRPAGLGPGCSPGNAHGC